MHKTSVYTLVNGNIKKLAHRKQEKSQKMNNITFCDFCCFRCDHKRWYYSAAHWHTVSV